MENLKIQVLTEPSKENPFIVIYKPHNLPSAPLTKDDRNNALFQAGELFPEVYSVKGRKEIEYGLIHRLDTVTAGLILISLTQDFYDKMMKIQAQDKFIKYYWAQCDICTDNADTLGGFPPLYNSLHNYKCNDIVHTKSHFRSFGDGAKEVRPVTEKSGMAALKKLKSKTEYETEISLKDINEETHSAEVLCKITRGYRHQVRCHLAWAGLPIKNDPLYNSNFINKKIVKDEFGNDELINDLNESDLQEIMFEAIGFEFPHPYKSENSPDCEYVFWNKK